MPARHKLCVLLRLAADHAQVLVIELGLVDQLTTHNDRFLVGPIVLGQFVNVLAGAVDTSVIHIDFPLVLDFFSTY